MKALPELRGLDAARFDQEVLPRGEPVVLRGLVREWPAVRRALQSPEAVCRYVQGFDRGTPVDALLMPPEVGGRIFYTPGLSAFNYVRKRVPISTVIEQVVRYSHFPVAPAVAAQSAPIHECLPGFETENVLPAPGCSATISVKLPFTSPP